MAKATHHGECQVCGHQQLLPNGRLSTHGYLVKWSCFVGTCPGSKHLPFELSIHLILDAIQNARVNRDLHLALAAKLRATPDAGATKAWVSLYRPATWQNRKSGHEWHEVELTRTEETKDYGKPGAPYLVTLVEFSFANPLKEGRIETLTKLGMHYGLPNHGKCTTEEAIQHLNSEKATSVHDSAVKHFESYIRWQERRIANWQPRPLQERKAK